MNMLRRVRLWLFGKKEDKDDVVMKISKVGLKLIEEYEGFKSEPYLCPAGVPTIGIGTTYYEDGTLVTLNDAHISKKRALEILRHQVDTIYGSAVNRYVKVDLTQNQFDSLASFTYNLGASNFRTSTLLKRVNAERHNAAANQFKRWNRAGGKKLKGLTRRRKAESKLYLA